MAHVREEFALGPTRGLGGQLGALQLRLDLPPRGDVDGDPEDAAAPALDVDRHLGRLQPPCPAIGGEGLLGDEHRLAAIDHALVVLEEALDLRLGKPETPAHLLVGHADHLLRGQSVDVRHGLVGQDPDPVAVLDEGERGARVDHRLEQGVMCAEGGLGALALGRLSAKPLVHLGLFARARGDQPLDPGSAAGRADHPAGAERRGEQARGQERPREVPVGNVCPAAAPRRAEHGRAEDPDPKCEHDPGSDPRRAGPHHPSHLRSTLAASPLR